MKTTKKIFAALLAVMMIALMIPFSASAANSYTANITGRAGYTASVYKIADVDTTTGKISNALTTEIGTLLNTNSSNAGVASANLLKACEALDATTLGTVVKTLTFTASGITQAFTTTTAGVYYVKVTGTPGSVSVKRAGGAVFALPYYTDNAWTYTVNALLKIEDGEVSVKKEIVEGETLVTSTTANIGDTITYKLTASVTGSAEQPLKEYTIHDNMSNGLTFASVSSVAVDDNTLPTTAYTVNSSNKSDITIALTSDYLAAAATNGFYSASNVVVTLTATLNENAVIKGVGNDNSNDNSDSLTYTNAYGQKTVTGTTVKVYTFELPVVKVDANNNTTVLSDAKFQLYSDAGCTTVAENGTEATTGADGKVTFSGLKAGTYYLKETGAPTGYNLNSTVYTIVISADGTITSNGTTVPEVTVEDTPIIMPATGGMGTMVFTIVGVSLIACAGVLFLVVRKKKASK